jgi:hypothetical protein
MSDKGLYLEMSPGNVLFIPIKDAIKRYIVVDTDYLHKEIE